MQFVSVEEYLATSYPDGDREYLDGVVVERNLGTPDHSVMLQILTVHLGGFARQLGLAVRPACRTRIREARYGVPDMLVMQKPFFRTDRVILDAPLLIVEVLSPDDRLQDVLRRLQEYQKLGVHYIVQMDPEDRTTHLFINGDLVRRDDLASFETRNGTLPFPAKELLARLDEEQDGKVVVEEPSFAEPANLRQVINLEHRVCAGNRGRQ
jgi:Uma2 family endonuclease